MINQMKTDKAIEILGDVERGLLTFNDDFKQACKMGKLALISIELIRVERDTARRGMRLHVHSPVNGRTG